MGIFTIHVNVYNEGALSGNKMAESKGMYESLSSYSYQLSRDKSRREQHWAEGIPWFMISPEYLDQNSHSASCQIGVSPK